MSELRLWIPGEPKPKARPRVYQGHAMTPDATKNAEGRVYAEFRRKYPDMPPLEDELIVKADFWTSRRGRPDVDNLLKLVLDALNGCAWVDDDQIVDLRGVKHMPDKWMPRADGKGLRKRKTGDPLTWRGAEYQAHTEILIRPITPNKPQ